VAAAIAAAAAGDAKEAGAAAAGGSSKQEPEEPKGWFELKVSSVRATQLKQPWNISLFLLAFVGVLVPLRCGMHRGCVTELLAGCGEGSLRSQRAGSSSR
jgi:hypothetical protein